MEVIKYLAKRIDQSWQRMGHSEAAFADIAAESLSDAAIHRELTTADILRWLSSDVLLPTQFDLEAKFADPPLTLHVANAFYIAAYFWADGTTNVHQHAFTGAFQVLDGSSLHVEYEFERSSTHGDQLHFGRLGVRRHEVLKRGDVRRIPNGPSGIHSLFHLDQPSVTLIVRTTKGLTLPQLAYLAPGVAYDEFDQDALWVRQSPMFPALDPLALGSRAELGNAGPGERDAVRELSVAAPVYGHCRRGVA